MKRILFLFIILLCLNVTQTKAQVYHKFLNNSSWCVSENPGFGQPIGYYVYNQSIDTVINNATYTKIVVSDGEPAFFVREDTIAKKVFILTDTANAPEVILYDFSLNVGDTLYAKHGWGAGNKLIVRTIDTVTTLVGQRRQFTLMDTSGNYGYSTTESVGWIVDPFLFHNPIGDPVYYLVCSYQNHIQVYDANLYGYTCYYYDSIPCNAAYTYTIGLSGQITVANTTPVYYSSQWSCYTCTVANYGATTTINFPCNGTYTVGCLVSMNSSGNDVCGYYTQNITINNIPGSLQADYTY